MNELSLNRDALVIYLKNLSIVETVIYQSERKKQALLDELQAKQNEIQNAKDTLHSFENGEPGFVAAQTTYVPDYFQEFMDNGGCYTVMFLPLLPFWALIILAIWSRDRAKALKKNEQYRIVAEQRNAEIQRQWNSDFADARQRCTQLQEEYNRKAPVIRDEVARLDSAIAGMKRIRENMYRLNIVPYAAGSSADLRTLAGVQYLYEFMANSRESFTTAVYNFKLDAIISRLDSLIANTERIIANQHEIMYQQERQLQAILQQEQNQQRIISGQQKMNESLENIRDYEAMIAQNSEVQTALAQEALYYQRVRFYADL